METEHVSADEIEILPPLGEEPPKTFGQKYGAAIFWGTMVALPVMNLAASVLDYRTAKMNLEIEKLKEAAEAAA